MVIISGGVCIKDIGGSTLSWEQTKQEEEIRSVTNFGFSYQQPLKQYELKIIASYDHSGLYGGENKFGIEAEYRKQFSFRFGLNSSTLAVGAGVNFNFLMLIMHILHLLQINWVMFIELEFRLTLISSLRIKRLKALLTHKNNSHQI